MSKYLLILIWPLIAFILSRYLPCERCEMVAERKERRLTPAIAWLTFMPIIIMAGFRGTTFGDSYNYSRSFLELPSTLSGLIAYLPDVTKDKGFTVLIGLIKIIIGNQDVVYFLILATIQGACLIYTFRKYSTNYFMSIFLFIASSDYLSWMFNGVRQFTAVTLVFAATSLMVRKKYISLIIVILIASTIHGTALLMLPIVFIAQGKAWNEKTIFVIFCSLMALTYVDSFTNILDMMLADTQYTNVVSDWQSWNDDGTNVFRVLVYSIPAMLSFLGRKYIREDNNSVINLCTNMSIISTGIYLVSMGTSGIFIGRLPIYCSLYSYILLPYIIDRMFTKNSARIVNMSMVVAYVAFYYYQVGIGWKML